MHSTLFFWAFAAITSSLVNAQADSAASRNFLVNPSFENISSSGLGGDIYNWSHTGKVYPVNYPPSAQQGTTYAVLRIDNPSSATPTLYQTLTGLDTAHSYRLSAYYDLYELDGMKSCTLAAFVGDARVYKKKFTAADKQGANNWKLAKTNALVPKSSKETIKFQYTCVVVPGADVSSSAFFLDNTHWVVAGSQADSEESE